MNTNVALLPMPERGSNHFEFKVRLQSGCVVRGELEATKITRYKDSLLLATSPIERKPGETLTDALFRTVDNEVQRFWERDAKLRADAERVRPFARIFEHIYENGPPASLYIGKARHSVEEQAFINDFTLGASYTGRLLRYTTDEDEAPYKTVCFLVHPSGNVLSFATNTQNSVSDIFRAGSPRIERLLHYVAMDDDPRLQKARDRLLPCRRA